MYISLKWIKDLIIINNINLNNLSEKLTLAGFEVEEIKQITNKKGKDIILDLAITPNRADLYNINAIKNELLAIFYHSNHFISFKKQLKALFQFNNTTFNGDLISTNKFTQNQWQYLYRQQIINKILCLHELEKTGIKFNGLYASFTSIVEIPKDFVTIPLVSKRILSSQLQSRTAIENLIDLVLLETGYPFFVYDWNKLSKLVKAEHFEFTVRKAFENEDFVVSKDEIISLNPNNILLLVNDKPISIIGSTDYLDIRVDGNTKKVIIFSALLDNIKIKKSLQTMVSKMNCTTQLQKRLNINQFESAILRLKNLLFVQNLISNEQLFNNISLYESNSIEYMKKERKPIKISFSNVKDLANQNVDLSNERIIRILNSLNLTVCNKTESSCSVWVPFSRNLDLLREVDVIEEIIRISGFTDLNARLPISVQKGKVPKIVQLKQKFRKAFVNFGLNEVMHFTLASKHEVMQPILKNPILNEKTALRSTLISSLIEKSSLNQRQSSFTLQAFEFGRIYQQSLNNNNNTRIIEKEILSGIFSDAGYAQDWLNSHKDLNWFEGKGFMEDCFSQIGLKPDWVNAKLSNKSVLELFHQTKTAELHLNSQIIGHFGQINPVIAKHYNLSKNLFIFELDLDAISAHWTIKNSFRYENYSVYPSLSVDLSLIIPAQITFNKLNLVFKEISLPILKTITLLDYYEGRNIPDGHYSLTVKLEFQTFEKTLTTEEIDNKIITICDNLKTQYNVLMRS